MDDFGREVAISKNGKVVAVGQYFSEIRVGMPWTGDYLGSVTVYDENSTGQWNQRGSTFEGMPGDPRVSDDEKSRMGYDVKLSGDGSVLIITQPYLNFTTDRGHKAGDVYVYKWNGSSWILRENFWGEANSLFGKNLDISDDGDVIVISRQESSASRRGVAIHEWDGSTYKEIQTIGNRSSSSEFGRALAISGDGLTFAVGYDGATGGQSGQYRGGGSVYKRSAKGTDFAFSTGFSPTGATDASNGNFGYSCSLNYDGTIVAFGAPYGRNNGIYVTNVTGKAYVYKYNNTWTQIGGTIIGNVGAVLGYSISLSDSGNELIVGEPRFSSGRGLARVYKIQNNSWIQKYLISGSGYNIERAGTSVAMSGDAHKVVVGSHFAQLSRDDFTTPGCVGIWSLPPY
jgi:hypothetical protein